MDGHVIGMQLLLSPRPRWLCDCSRACWNVSVSHQPIRTAYEVVRCTTIAPVR